MEQIYSRFYKLERWSAFSSKRLFIEAPFHRWTSHSMNKPFDEQAIRWTSHSMNKPFDEQAIRLTSHSMNKPFDEQAIRLTSHSMNKPFDEKLFRWKAVSMKSCFNEKQFWWKAVSMKSSFDEKLFRWKGTPPSEHSISFHKIVYHNAGNPYRTGSPSTHELLIKVACLVKK